jgi:hypothetical protein
VPKSLDTIVEFAVDTRTRDTDKTTIGHVDALRKLGVAIGTFLVGRKALQLTELLFRTICGLATVTRTRTVAVAAVRRSRFVWLQHNIVSLSFLSI